MTYSDGVTKSSFHQCMYGLMSKDSEGWAPAYKPTSVLTNHPALAEVLQEGCSGNHRHAQLVGKGACSRAACYPRGLCDAVVKGIEVIKKRHEELDLVLRSCEQAGHSACGSVASVTGAHPTVTDTRLVQRTSCTSSNSRICANRTSLHGGT